MKVVVFGLVGMMSTACDVGGPDGRGPDAGEGWVVESHPSAGGRGVSRRPRIRARLDRRVLARAVNGSNVRLESGAVSVRLEMHFEPVRRELVFEPVASAPPLRPHTAYRIRIRGLVDLDGERQPEAYTAVFQTGEAVHPPPASTRASWEDAWPILDRHCIDGPCHDAERPAAGLRLASGEGAAQTALNVPSTQFPRGAAVVRGAPGARALAGLPIIDVLAGRGTPAASYLLYKVLADPHIVGEPMPPPRDGRPGGLSSTAARTLSDWIRVGAPTD